MAMKKSRAATIVKPTRKGGVDEWLALAGVKRSKEVLLFKRVSEELKTQEGLDNETRWSIGKEIECRQWNPTGSECGAGKFHAVPAPCLADEFRDSDGDKYIAILVARKDLHAWPNPQYPNKIAFRKGKVMYECDRNGNKI